MAATRHRALPTPAEPADGSTTWGVLLANLFGRAVLGVLAGLLLWTLLPTFLGWNTTMVMSDSMAPALRTGDALIAQPTTAAHVRPGQVLVVNDPDHAGRLRAHRLEEIRNDGTFILRGDANQQADSTPVPLQDLRGLGRLRIPFVALPGVWLQTGHPFYALGSVLFLGLMVLAAAVGPARTRDAAVASYRAARHRATRRRVPRGLVVGAPLTTMAFALSVTLVVVVTGSVAPAYAKFSASTSNPPSTWTASDSFCTAPGSVAVVATADSAINESGPNANFGDAPELRVASSAPSRNNRSLVRFPLPAIPNRCSVTAAMLSFTVTAGDASRTLIATVAEGKWEELGVTWANQPPATGASARSHVNMASNSLAFRVTNQVEALYTGMGFGFVIADELENDSPDSLQRLQSRETDSPPTLTVTFG